MQELKQIPPADSACATAYAVNNIAIALNNLAEVLKYVADKDAPEN